MWSSVWVRLVAYMVARLIPGVQTKRRDIVLTSAVWRTFYTVTRTDGWRGASKPATYKLEPETCDQGPETGPDPGMRSKISTATATATNRNRNSEPQRCKNLPYYLTATPTATLTATSTATPTAILNRNASDYARDRKPSQIEGKIILKLLFEKNNL